MLEPDTIQYVNGVLAAMPEGRLFSLHNLGLPGYSGMTNGQRRGAGKRLDDSVRKHLLDTADYEVQVVPNTKKPQMYIKKARATPNGPLLIEATPQQIIRRLGALLGLEVKITGDEVTAT